MGFLFQTVNFLKVLPSSNLFNINYPCTNNLLHDKHRWIKCKDRFCLWCGRSQYNWNCVPLKIEWNTQQLVLRIVEKLEYLLVNWRLLPQLRCQFERNPFLWSKESLLIQYLFVMSQSTEWTKPSLNSNLN